MKKKLLLLVLVSCCYASGLWAQNTAKVAAKPRSLAEHAKEKMLMERGLSEAPRFPNVLGGNQPTRPTGSGKTNAVDVVAVGTGSNAYTILRSGQNQVMVNNTLGVLGFIHRQNIEEHGGNPATTANGIPRVDYASKANLSNWSLDLGPTAPMPYPNSNAARIRYPQGTFWLPGNTGGVSDLRLIWEGACTDGNGWGNVAFGCLKDPVGTGVKAWNAQDPNIKFGFLSNKQDNKTLIPDNLCMGKDGEFWFSDIVYTQTSATAGIVGDSVTLFKGTMNAAKTEVTFAPYVRFGRTAANPCHRVEFFKDATTDDPVILGTSVAFSPDGKYGWFCVIADVKDPENPNDFDLNPIFFKSDDFGATWCGPMEVRLRDYPYISSKLLTEAVDPGTGEVVKSSGIPMAFGGDLVVDRLGNPHFFTKLVNSGDSFPTPDTRYQYNPGFNKQMWDITTSDRGTTWCPKVIAELYANDGALSGSDLTWTDNYPQLAIDKTGDRVFYSWIDDTLTTNPSVLNPDVWERALRISDDAMTDLSSVSFNDPVYGGKMLYPTMAPEVLHLDNGDYLLPTVFLKVLTNDLNPCEFYFIKNRTIKEDDFKKPAVDLEITSLVSPAAQVCFATEATVTIEVKNVGTETLASVGQILYSYVSPNGTPFSASQPVDFTGNPLAVGATRQLTFTTPAAISASGLYVFNVQANFVGDQNCQNSQKLYNVVNFGGGNQQIFAETNVNGCGSLILDSGFDDPTISTSWTIKDLATGGTTTETGSSIEIDAIGEYEVTVTATSSQCTGSLNDLVNVNVYEIPSLASVNSYVDACQGDAITLNADPNNNSELAVEWTGPQNSTSKVFSPTVSGDYSVRLYNTVTGCEINKNVEVRFWNIAVNISGLRNYSCGPFLISALDGNPSVAPANGGSVNCNFKFERIDGGSATVVQDGTDANYQTEIDQDGQPSTYRVTVTDPKGCKTVTSEVTVQTYDIGIAKANFTDGDELKIVKEGAKNLLPGDCEICFEAANTTEGGAPVYAWEWKVAGPPTGYNAVTSLDDVAVAPGTTYANLVSQKKLGDLDTKGPNKICVKWLNQSSHYNAKRVTLIAYGSPGANDSTGNACDSSWVYNFEVRNKTTLTGSSCVGGSIEDAGIEELNVYPNPSSSDFNINLTMAVAQDLKLEVTDLTGRVVYTANHSKVSVLNDRIRLENAAPGVYFLKVQTNGGAFTSRLVKY